MKKKPERTGRRDHWQRIEGKLEGILEKKNKMSKSGKEKQSWVSRILPNVLLITIIHIFK